MKAQKLRGWRLELFNHLIDKKYIEIKNHELKVTDRFMRLLNKKMKEGINMAIDEKLVDALDNYFLVKSGFASINGGYARTTVKKVKLKDGTLEVKGNVVYGKDNDGCGESSKYRNEFILLMEKKEDKYNVIRILKNDTVYAKTLFINQ